MTTTQQLTIVGAKSGTSVKLSRGTLLSFGDGRASVHLSVCEGGLWITAAGDPEDRVLRKGDEEQIRGRHVIAEALTDSVVCVG